MSANTGAGTKLIRRWMEEVWNQQRAETIDELVASDAKVYGLCENPSEYLIGPTGFKEFHKTFCGAFSEIRLTVEDAVEEGDLTAVRFVFRARHSGGTLGMAATGNQVEASGMAFLRVKDGKFVEAWNNFDFKKMNKDLGIA